MPDRSLLERLEAVTADLAEISEGLAAATYEAIEAETLKRVAIAAGVDHTMESTRVIEALGHALQHGRDVNREPSDAPCRICRRVDYAPEFCDGHTEDVIRLAEMIGAAIWGGDPCPDENLVAHLDDAVAMIATGAERRLGDPEWRVVQWGDDEYELSGLADRSWSIIQVGDRLWGLDPNEEGPGVPRRLDELLADLL